MVTKAKLNPYEIELRSLALRQIPLSIAHSRNKRMVLCSAFCKRSVSASHAKQLTNGEYCCKECISLLDKPDLLVPYPSPPTLPQFSFPQCPSKRDYVNFNTLFYVGVAAFWIGWCLFALIINVSGHADDFGWCVGGIILLVIVIVVSVLRRYLHGHVEYKRALATFLNNKPAIDKEYTRLLAENEQKRITYEHSHEKQLWDAMMFIRCHVSDFYPEYPPDWHIRSEKAKQRDGYQCTRCHSPKQKGNPLHVHHKVKLSKGGSNELDNLVTLCYSCHRLEPDHEHLAPPCDPLEGMRTRKRRRTRFFFAI